MRRSLRHAVSPLVVGLILLLITSWATAGAQGPTLHGTTADTAAKAAGANTRAHPAQGEYANCRLGVGASGNIAAYPMETLNLGWYVNWRTDLHPLRPGGAHFAQMIRLQQTASAGYRYKPTASEIQQTAIANPGAIWLIGNEPDRRTYQDELPPALYAQAYHELYILLKETDPTARIAVGGIVQATPIRLKYLDMVLQTYRERYGQRLPADLWNIHTFVLREEADSWGADLPPGIDTAIGYQGTWRTEPTGEGTVHSSVTAGDQAVLSFEGGWASWTALAGPEGGSVRVSIDHQLQSTTSTYAVTTTRRVFALNGLGYGRHALTLEVVGDGKLSLDEFHAASAGATPLPDDDPSPSMLYTIRDHDRLDLVAQQVRNFRQWLAARGERDKPLIISEYGVLFPEYIVDEDGHNFNSDRVAAFLTGSFDLFRGLRDPQYGLPADDSRLVQGWAWYSLNDRYFNGALFDTFTKQATPIGIAFQNYAQQIPAQVDLLPVEIAAAPIAPDGPAGEPITMAIHVSVANAGNVALPITNTIRLWDGDPQAGGTPLGDVPILPGLDGCGARTTVTFLWPAASAGNHEIYAQLDPDNVLTEANETNNVLAATVLAGPYRIR
ncbi:MAG: hypothetical protein GXP41_02570, partial [Chloroflexi bacterium]|nr:hypothetical protein [Chloroflexota bacterium]